MKLLLFASILLARSLALPNSPAGYGTSTGNGNGNSLTDPNGLTQNNGQGGHNSDSNAQGQNGHEHNGNHNNNIPGSNNGNNGCQVSISPSEANDFINRFNAIEYHKHSDLGDPKQTAQQILAHDFQFTSYSVQSLLDQPLGVVQSGSQFISGATDPSHPGPRKITVVHSVARCDQITFEWQYDGEGSGRYPVRGFSWFSVRRVKTSASQRSPIQAVKHTVEFDSIAWLLNNGGAVTYANGTTSGGSGGKGCNN